jgi:hypothetical protein
MKNIVSLILVFTLAHVAFGQSEEESVKAVVTSAYIEGIQNRGNVEDVRKGFHPTFTMLRLVDNTIKPLPIEEWITNLEKSKKEATTPGPKTEGKFLSVDITGTAAVVKLELYRESKKVFTDYLVLNKFTEGWRIISKTYFRH